jgi:hypothetical protein
MKKLILALVFVVVMGGLNAQMVLDSETVALIRELHPDYNNTYEPYFGWVPSSNAELREWIRTAAEFDVAVDLAYDNVNIFRKAYLSLMDEIKVGDITLNQKKAAVAEVIELADTADASAQRAITLLDGFKVRFGLEENEEFMSFYRTEVMELNSMSYKIRMSMIGLIY